MRAYLCFLSGLVALSTILPTTAYADENTDVRGDVEGNSVTITGTNDEMRRGISPTFIFDFPVRLFRHVR